MHRPWPEIVNVMQWRLLSAIEMYSLPLSFAAERNKQPILEVLSRLLPGAGTALEIASGTGQHVAWFAAAMPLWTWQPTEADECSLAAIAAYSAAAGVTNVRAPLRLDVTTSQWPASGPPFTEPFDAIYCANLLHIAPWEVTTSLMQGAARLLAPGGTLVLYGPYLEDEVATAPGNLAFDASLRSRNPSWGLRRRENVALEAHGAGLLLKARHPMPADNLLLAFGPGH